MPDIERRLSKLEERIVRVEWFSDLPLEEMKLIALDYASDIFGRKLLLSEWDRFRNALDLRNLNLSTLTEVDLYPPEAGK